ncbi:GDSL-type esterase/lipase family protein [Acinetobacter sp. Marseille-Q1623]|uniref:GDSL-type esterase/lipase family protein n=1 Tax=Acinetobacter sp. Marseille-Q1623 TaxID=2697501 RepID=UPI00157A815F|nr:GDSL-type esterase/lipase family protein [Acinetobacter sp. Marseille-Q1623]
MTMIKKNLSVSILATLAIGQSFASNLSNFNEPNTAKLNAAIQNRDVHVVQLGDSHTAADEMTHVLRQQLQNALGDGGMGWGMPMYFSGQRMARFGYDNSGWRPVSSRTQRNDNYTLGGLNAVPQYAGATLTIKAKQVEQVQKILVSIRQAANDMPFTGIDADGKTFTLEAPVKNNHWQTVTFTAKLPFTITAQNTQNSALGGWWAKNQNGSGAVVSALGINGAELSYWNRWSNDWQNELTAVAPNLVILAYGTNEAYNDNLDVEQARSILVDKIQKIRASSPQTAVMIVSAPESLKRTAGECGSRPIKLSAVQSMQLQVAQSMHTLYWDWQKAMGGSCSMKSWINQGLGRADGVHFSASGYQRLGRSLASDLLNLSGVNIDTRPASTTEPNQTNSTPLTNYGQLGFAQICLEGSSECKSIGR